MQNTNDTKGRKLVKNYGPTAQIKKKKIADLLTTNKSVYCTDGN